MVVPEGQIQALLQAYHAQLGHQGQERTVSLLRRHFHWQGIFTGSVKSFIQKYPCCRLFKTRKPLVPIWAKAPLHIMAMDYLTLGRPTEHSSGNQPVHKICLGHSNSGPDCDYHCKCSVEDSIPAIWVSRDSSFRSRAKLRIQGFPRVVSALWV